MAYTTKSGDTWDGIAKSVYGDELKADVLMAANREYIEIYRFDSGVELVRRTLKKRWRQTITCRRGKGRW